MLNKADLRVPLRYARRTFNVLRGRDLWQGAQMECEGVFLGEEHACWYVSPAELLPGAVVYSFGVGEEISFDLELIERFGVCVHAFDPTPRSIRWVRSQSLPRKFLFHPYGVADFDGTCEFLPPKNPAHVSHTLLERQSPGPAIQVPVYRLSTIMNLLGHEEVDILKMDIEGAEYRVLVDLLECAIPIKQLLVEFHHRWVEVGARKTRDAIGAMNRAGYQIFHVSSSGEEYSFKNLSRLNSSLRS